MLEIFDYSFMVRALAAGLIVALTIPVLGSFLVAKRYSLIADGLAHVSLAGVGAGLLLGFAPVALAVPVALAGGLVLEWLRQKQRLSGEVSLAVLMSAGLAVAVVLANLARGANVDFASYLFGSITTTTPADVVALSVVGGVTLAIVAVNYRALVHMTFDEDSARLAGHRVSLLSYTLTVLTALVVVLSLRIVGGLLISALLVMPVVAASWLSRSFWQTIVLAVCLAGMAVLSGLVVAFYAGIAAGGAIVLAALVLLLLAMVWRR